MKHLLITGASKGVGLHLSKYYLERGYEVTGISRTEPELEHQHFSWVPVDISSEADVLHFFAEVRREKRQLYGLINNAAVAAMNVLSTTPISTAQLLMNTNAIGTFLMMREASKVMIRQNRGRIINFTSVARPLNIEWESMYSASKAAIESITRTAAREFAASGITVNAVGPGPMRTDLTKNVGEERLDYVLQKQAIKRMSEMKDVTHVCDFFLSEESDMITGQVIFLGGVSG